MKLNAILCSIFLILSASGLAYGQTQQISGTVKDNTGAIVPNAVVTVTNNGTGQVQTVTSNSDGNFVVLNIAVGTYTVTATAPGFKTFVDRDVIVQVNSTPTVPVTLQIGQATQTVTVTANPIQVDTTSSVVGAVITHTAVANIQLNGRNYTQLMQLSPGVSNTVASGFAMFGTYGISGSASAVDGVRSDSISYFIDGVDDKDNGGSSEFVDLSPDAVEEFKDSASTYDASSGGTSGASVSTILRSGTNSFHGGGYDFLRNRAIEAYPYQPVGTVKPIKPPFVYNDFGYQLGGPIFKDRLLFFGGQEFKRWNTGTVSTFAVPSALQKSGNFSSYPSSEWPIDPATGAAFAGGIVPTCAASGLTSGCATTNGQGLMQLFPGANAGTNFTFSYQTPINTTEYFLKLDYLASEKNVISGTLVYDKYTRPDAAATNLIEYTIYSNGLIYALNWTRTINSTTVNTLTGSLSGDTESFTNDIRPNPFIPNLTSIDRSAYGMNYPTLYGVSPDIPTVTATGFTELAATALGADDYLRIYAVRDDFSKVIKNSTLKLGVYMWRMRKNQTAPPAINGTLGFTGNSGQSGQLADNQALANELMGNFATYSEGSAIEQVWARFSQMAGYFQDDWKVSNRLTLNLGFRWQYMEPDYSSLNNISTFDPQYYSSADAATLNASGIITSNPYPYNGMVLGGSGFPAQATCCGRVPYTTNPQVLALFHNLPRSLMYTHWWNGSAPRLGFAYDLNGKGTTVLHGGYGLSYERIEGNYFFNSVANTPFVAVSNLINGNVDSLTSAPAAANPVSVDTSWEMNAEPPRIKMWSFGIQQQVSGGTIAELDYVGSSSADLTWDQNLNTLAAGTVQANPGVSFNALRPYLGYEDIDQMENGGISNYNSLQAQLVKRTQSGGELRIAYTWSKELTDSQSFSYKPQNGLNLRGDYGPSETNQPVILSVSYVYPLPFWRTGNEFYKKALGNWQISGVSRIASGLPILISQAANTDQSGDGITTTAERPNLVGNPFANTGGKVYLNAAAFALPAAGTFGDLQAYGIKGPVYNNWDASLQKTFPIREELALDFRAEMFDFPNHLSAFTTDDTTTDASFGDVTATTDPRTMEFALKINF